MNLKCMINGKVSGVFLPSYNDNNRLVQGNTIAEDYSETLDSGSIVLSDVPKINDLDPYDDVYIWDSDVLENFTGITKTQNNGFWSADYSIFQDANHIKGFYKHFLLDRFTEERNLLNQNNYTYKIELFSETKGLENIVCPNIKITQPLNIEKRLTTLQYMQNYLELYSPKIKVEDSPNSDSWHYEQKYVLSVEMKEMFEHHYCQEFSLNSPTLRELFTKLMVSKDCIPIVKDNIIYPLCLAKTRGEFVLSNDDKSFIQAQKTSDGYMTEARTNYSNALSPNPTCHRVEHLGFRNSDEAIMTINNMRLETSFPIYKLNRVYMCYYKKCQVTFSDGSLNAYFLCKQDITKLCVLNNERQSLYKDTRVAAEKNTNTINFMKDNYYFTVGYSIGSNLITGFGEMFQYIEKGLGLTTIDKKECIIRNILNNLDNLYPYGIDGLVEIKNKILSKFEHPEQKTLVSMDFTPRKAKGFSAHNNNENGNIPSIFLDDDLNKTLNSVNDILNDVADSTIYEMASRQVAKLTNATLIAAAKGVANLLTEDSLLIKGLTFEIDYEGFYNGAVITNKEIMKNQVMKNDNQSESMPYLDLDGIARERKIQKMGNKSYTITARYDNWDDVQEVGTVMKLTTSDENLDEEEEIIIYHRDISIYDNKIDVTYFGQESFVLKNFYTSVFAKQRLFNVLDYGSSITRAENVKDILYVSKRKWYSIIPNFSYTSTNYNNFSILDYLNFEKSTPIDRNEKINVGIINFSNKSISYLTDINTFTYGNSICFNSKMFDNITMGTNLDPLHLCGKVLGNITYTDDRNYRGTTQKLCTIYDDYETGRIENITFNLATSIKDEELYLDAYENLSKRTLTFTFENSGGVHQILSANDYNVQKIHDMLNVSVGDINYTGSYTLNYANYNVIKWQLNRLLYPLTLGNSNALPATTKNTCTKAIHKDANEIIDMTFQTQLMIDKKDKSDVFFSDLALKLSDLVGNVKKNDVNSIPRYITFLPFQYQRQFGQAYNYQYMSLQGFIVKVPKDALQSIIGRSLDVNCSFTISNTDNGKNRYKGNYSVDTRIVKYSLYTNSITFVDEEKIRVNCSYINAKYYEMGTEETNQSTPREAEWRSAYFYLNRIGLEYIDDIDKDNYVYFSNIYLVPADINILSAYVPNLTNYWTSQNGYLEYRQGIILSPHDGNGANTAFYAYTAATRPPVATDENQILNTFEIIKGDREGGYIYNYYNANYSGDYLSLYANNAVNSSGTTLLNVLFQDYMEIPESNTPQYFVQSIDVLRNIDVTNPTGCLYDFCAWDIFTTFNIETLNYRNRIVCVGGKQKIETSLTDEKIQPPFDSSFGDILRNNNNDIPCYEIIKISEYSGNMGYIDVDLTKVPNLSEYQSIQEWIYNADIDAYEFVCGFNISDEERTNGHIMCYVSLVGNLDLQVYNSKGLVVGKVTNKKPTGNSSTPNSTNITR